MTESRSFRLETPQGRALHGIVDLPELPGPRPTVFVCHGFKGFQEWAFLPSAAQLLAQRGFTAVRFNFSGAGMLPGDELVTDLDAFRRATIGGDLEDLAAVVAAAGSEFAAGRVDRRRLGLLGFSRGGGAALLAAAGPLRDRIGALVTWSAVGTFDRLGDDQHQAWRRDGEIVIENTRTGQKLPIGTEILDEIETRREELDLERAAARRTAPWLLVHGDQDETVPVAEAHALAAAAEQPFELRIVEGAGHTFQAVHPFAGPTPQLIEALNATQRWFRRHLASG